MRMVVNPAAGNDRGLALPPPPFVSARQQRVGANSSPKCGARKPQPLISSALSELAFDHQVPATLNTEQNNQPTSSLFSWTWNDLLCLGSADDGDLYFDAEERPLPKEESGMDSNGKLIAGNCDSNCHSNWNSNSNSNSNRNNTGKNSEKVLKNTPTSTKTSVLSSFSSLEISGCNGSDDDAPIGSVSTESVEVKLETTSGSSSFTTTTICQFRGGHQQPHHSEATPQDHSSFDPPSPQSEIARHNPFARIQAPPPPEELPVRFLRAGKGDSVEGQRRYEATLQWRKENSIDTILLEAHPLFEMVKENYPHYFHLRGRHDEPVFFEQPPKTDLEALRRGGMDLHGLVRHYAMVTEFQWQFLEPDDFARSIFVLDLDGMRMMDFVGECVEYVKMCSQFTGQHYPERAGHVIVINVPRWFAMIWKVVKPMVDDVTLQKISIVRGKDAVFSALSEKIPPENIPPEYGGSSMPLGDSPEEHELRALMRHNNALANGDFSCGGKAGRPPCKFCSWGPPRSY